MGTAVFLTKSRCWNHKCVDCSQQWSRCLCLLVLYFLYYFVRWDVSIPCQKPSLSVFFKRVLKTIFKTFLPVLYYSYVRFVAEIFQNDESSPIIYYTKSNNVTNKNKKNVSIVYVVPVVIHIPEKTQYPKMWWEESINIA